MFGGSKLAEHYQDLYRFKFLKQEDKCLVECENITDSTGDIKVVPGEWPEKRTSFASARLPDGFIIHGGAN